MEVVWTILATTFSTIGIMVFTYYFGPEATKHRYEHDDHNQSESSKDPKSDPNKEEPDDKRAK